MNTGLYLIRTALCLTFFYAIYRVLLHNKCRYAVNRYYLISSFLLSFIIPLITIDLSLIRIPLHPINGYTLPGRMDALYTGSETVPADSPDQGIHSGISLFVLISLLYFSGTLVFMIRYILDLLRLVRLIKKNEKQEFQQYTLVKLQYPVSPFSFFRYIFVYDGDIDSDDFRRFIITHEQEHIRNWHSLDSVFLGLGQIIQWFNPVVVLYKKAVIALHEFSADHAVIENTESLAGYQQKILKYACIRNNIKLTSSLSNTMIKKRFIMMTQQNYGRHTTLRVIASVIAAAFLLLAFSNGDKIGVKSLPDRMNLISSVPGSVEYTSPSLNSAKDTARHSVAEQPDSKSIQKMEDTKEIQILSEELKEMKLKNPPDSLSRLLHPGFFMNPGEFGLHMAEMQQEYAERQLRQAERQLRLADEQRMLAERLKPLCGDSLFIPDLERLRRMAEHHVRIDPLNPMFNGYFIFPPPVHPFPFNGDCPDKEEMRLRLEEQLRNLDQKHLKQHESMKAMEEKDLKMMQEQMEWQDKYRREMEKQREQMEKTRKQLMDEYFQMMNKFRDETGSK
jgi:bla regulator protein blaR1